MVRSSVSLASGLDHLFSLGDNPLALFRDITMHTEVPNMCQGEGSEANDDLDRQAVEQELRRYKEDGISDTISLVAFWEVGIYSISLRHFPLTWTILQKYEHVYPVLFCLAMDILPTQATAVPCERVFSSSKETCMLHRSQLDPSTIEMLQVLKHLYQRERLNFTAGLLAKEEDYTIEGPVMESAILELLKAGKEAELHDLYTNWAIESD